MEMAPEGTETTWREGLERSEDLSGQEGCRAESLEKSMGGAGGRGWTAKGLEEAAGRVRREYLPQHSESQGGG